MHNNNVYYFFSVMSISPRGIVPREPQGPLPIEHPSHEANKHPKVASSNTLLKVYSYC